MLIPKMELSNTQPILYDGLRPLMKGSFQAFSFPFGEIVLFTMILSSLKSKTASYRVYI